jgi:tetratricopeptide (TPR) repeat protein
VTKSEWTVVGMVCALVLGAYVSVAHSGYFVSATLNPADEYYNLLVQGFRAGQLNLKIDVPPGFAQLADPYDPAAHAPYPVLDMSYFRGKFYLYFGPTPALVLFWPYVALTGRYLLQKNAAVFFCFAGFLASAGILSALWRRYFAGVGVAVVAAGALALGLAAGTPLLLARCDVHEVSISCGYALTMLALAAIWKALHSPSQQGRWLAAASLSYGLAVGARPSLLFGAVILLVPVAQAFRERRNIWTPLLAATGPITFIGLGLMLYNLGRFGNPFEFGYRYQLAGDRMLTRPFFSLRYLWFNFRVYFLAPARWSAQFPFVHSIAVPPLPAGYVRAETPYGILTNTPLVWFALAAPLAWRNRSATEGWILRWFVLSAALLFGICACTVSLFLGAAGRYEADFLPALVLLGGVGILGLERALADEPVRRRVLRWVWILLLVFSMAFNLLACVWGYSMAHDNLGYVLRRAGRMQEAMAQFEEAVRLMPNYPDPRNNLADALMEQGRVPEAIGEYAQVVRLRPRSADAHYNLGASLQKAGWIQQAMAQYEQAVRLRPDHVDAHNRLASTLMAQGMFPEAIGEYEQVVRLKPDSAEAHYNWGVALVRLGKVPEAMGQFRDALRLKPDYAQAHNGLAIALATQGKPQEAMEQWEEAVRLKPDDAEAQCNLATALERAGRIPEAIAHYEQSLKLSPGFAPAKNALARLRADR